MSPFQLFEYIALMLANLNITVKDELYIYSFKTKGVGILNSEITQTDRVNRQNDAAPKNITATALPRSSTKEKYSQKGFWGFNFHIKNVCIHT